MQGRDMQTPIDQFDFCTLSIAQRIQIAHDLLDSVYADTQGEYFTPEQLEEIDRRVAAADTGKVVGEPMKAVFDQLLKP
jgi:putative addiction module component (TIGR02574 family)